MLAGGTGLAPILSMLEVLADRGTDQPVHLIYGVTNDGDLVEIERIEALAKQLPTLTWATCVANPESAHPLKGYVTAHLADEHLNAGDCDVYLCGPAADGRGGTGLLHGEGRRALAFLLREVSPRPKRWRHDLRRSLRRKDTGRDRCRARYRAGVALRAAAEGGDVLFVDRADFVNDVATEAGDAGTRLRLRSRNVRRGRSGAMAEAVSRFGGIDILINNVGGAIRMRPYDRFEPGQIEAEIRRSLMPTLWCCHAVLP